MQEQTARTGYWKSCTERSVHILDPRAPPAKQEEKKKGRQQWRPDVQTATKIALPPRWPGAKIVCAGGGCFGWLEARAALVSAKAGTYFVVFTMGRN